MQYRGTDLERRDDPKQYDESDKPSLVFPKPVYSHAKRSNHNKEKDAAYKREYDEQVDKIFNQPCKKPHKVSSLQYIIILILYHKIK